MSPQPTSPLALAQTAYSRGDLASARQFCRLSLERDPRDLAATFLLGLVYFRMGKPILAKGHFETCLRHEPASFEAHAAMATVEARLGLREEAIAHANFCIELEPSDPQAHNHLGLTLSSLGLADLAVNAFAYACELAPKNADFLRNLATSLRESRRELEAIKILQQLTELDPLRLEGWLSLGQLLILHGDHAAASAALTSALKIDDTSATAHLLMALALSESKEPETAENHLKRAIELNPSDGLSYAALGFWQQEKGDFEASSRNLTRAIELAPEHGFAYYNLFRTRKVVEEDKATLLNIKELVSNPVVKVQDKAYMEYALGKGYEDLGEYDRAILHYDSANQHSYNVWLSSNPWDRDQYAQKFASIQETQGKAFLGDLGNFRLSSELPIIVVGMIRSGTSLVEQIISSHPLVTGAGELDFWHRHEAEVYGEDPASVEPSRLVGVGQRYLEHLTELAPNSIRVVDKLPHNYALLGLIHGALPNARIVHLRRNPIDNCLSIYTTAYQRPPAFAHQRENIVFAYQEYEKLMVHWRNTLPAERFLELDYEDLLENREDRTRQLIEFCGLPWSDACLHHERNKRAVRTPSLWQVRQPIYTTSVERWRRFEPWISEFISPFSVKNPISLQSVQKST